METGRKFYLTLVGMLLCVIRPEAAEALAAMVLTFNGANAAVSWAYAGKNERSQESTSATTHAITERRDLALGLEPAP